MLLRCVFISSILVLVAARDFNNRFDTRDSIVEAEMSYLQAREEYIEGVKLLRRVSPRTAFPFTPFTSNSLVDKELVAFHARAPSVYVLEARILVAAVQLVP